MNAEEGKGPPGIGRRAQALMQAGRLDEARREIAAHLAEQPDDGEARYLLAVCARYQRDFAAAHETLRDLLEREPGNGRAWQELAHLARDAGDPDEAIRLYAAATGANPALLASYRQRLALLQSAGRTDEATQTRLELQRIETLPKPLLAVTDLLGQGRVLRAETLCRQYLQQQPHDPQGMRLLADIGVRLGALEEAHFLLETACELAPDSEQLRIALIRVLAKRQRFAESLAEAEKLLAAAPGNLHYRSIHAIELLQIGRYDEAIAAFEAILAEVPDDPATLTSRGHALKTCGRAEDAVLSYERAARARDHSEAWYALANLKTYRFDDAAIERMQALARTPGRALMDRVYLDFALGKAFEDRGDFEKAFEHFERGNGLKHAQVRYRSDRFRAEIDELIEQTGADLFEAAGRGGCEAPDPIFIVGMPRAGSTLVEQIIAAHSAVDGTRELPNILSLAQKLRRRTDPRGERPGYPRILRSLEGEARRAFGEDYLAQARVHRGDAPYFIDKMPNNFRHIALIHLILPNAKIIDARREAMACCFSNFQQLFAEGQEFSYSLRDLGHYYRDYERLMAHVDRALPAKVFRLQHEVLLDDFEGEVRRLLDYLQLPFEDGCLRYWESDRAVRTPSSEQVRQPLFRDAVDRWQHYRPWLQPLVDSLAA